MAYWMKDVLQDLEQFCERNKLKELQRSLAVTEQILDEEIRIREETMMSPEPEEELAKTGT